ncbi:hypothetical protein ACUXQ2_005520 [Cupriavidus metallidurans]|uniref:hypothetical protein n=1 Tax=Cupriavidus sp. HMR-1 TaxID=1249621 RepID=UPI0002A3BD5D|nr:hypothetical protein [Cupriavidus sp. HMR-1]EKZ98862.1 hypothetical protein D769_12946 [Cupriavidus sp. HMR-1]
MNKISTALLVCLAAGAAHADGVKTVTQQLLEKDAQLALQKLDQDLAKGNPAPTSVAATPTSSPEQRARDEAPKTIALYGVDGRAAGLPLTLRSYVKWGDQVYAAKVGGSMRGYKVVSISEAGTKLSRGKQTINAARVDEDAVILAGEQSGGETRTTPKHAGPLPGGTQPGGTPPVSGAPSGFTPFPPLQPKPGSSTVPAPTAAPTQPPQVGSLALPAAAPAKG